MSKFNFNIKDVLKTYAIALSLLLMACIGSSQQSAEMNFDELLSLAGAENKTLNMIASRTALSQAEWAQSRDWWIPDLYAGLHVHQLWGNVLNSDGQIFRDVDRQSFSGAIGLEATFDFHEGAKNNKLSQYLSDQQTLQSTIDRNEFLLDVIRSYYQAIGSNLEAEAYAKLIFQGDSIIEQLDLLVEQGLQYNTDLLLAKSNRENNKISFGKTLQTLDRLTYELKILLNISEESDVQFVGPLKPISLLNSDSAQATLPALALMEKRFDAKQFEYKSAKREAWVPTLHVQGYTSLFGGVFDPLDPTHAINGGLGWNIPLSRLSGAEMQILEIEKILLSDELDLLKIKADYSVKRIQNDIGLLEQHINSAQSAVTFAKQALDETIIRQNLGLARPFEIEMAEKAFIQSRINYIQGVVSFNIRQYELFVAMGNNL